MVLWMQWNYRGTLCASKISEVFELNASKFQEQVLVQRQMADQCRRYARIYVETIGRTEMSTESVSDIWGTHDIVQDMVHAMIAEIGQAHRGKFKWYEMIKSAFAHAS